MVVARSAKEVRPTFFGAAAVRSRSQGNVSRCCGTPGVSPTSSESKRRDPLPVRVLRPQGRPRGLNAEGGTVGGENANWVFE